ncbi:hypothetical protein PPERSA_10435 [Pseudocohnilembus persalinus]|uniref:Uncharacterized protein n=1 Tax=Pseudocohnilembus persalinus TaxID=266149 RepID=A0A0V0R0L0_PSEPJ|nr:hypothetical protein PPERSA_10435 [Pseudocohnilembus persalinus]|eukprot:KRX08073.1 hypothetical protein PPERSA_10435 [Pseudocohnilembus persalinus]
MSFFSVINIAKYVFRAMHIIPMVFIGGKLFIQNVFPQVLNVKFDQNLENLQDYAALIMTVGGFVNIFLLQTSKKMGKQYKNQALLWKINIYLKFATMIFYSNTLLSFVLPNLAQNPEKLVKARFHIFNMWLLIAPFLRFWREHYTQENNKQREKVKSN